MLVGTYLFVPQPRELSHIGTFEWGRINDLDDLYVSIWIWNISGITLINTQVGFEVYKRDTDEWL